MLFSFSLFHKTTLGISLGSSNTYIARHGKGIVLGEPSVVATDIYNEKVAATGDKAKKMIGRAPETISVDRPISRDIINFVRKNYNILIGDGTAEDVKKQLGCASDVKNMELMTLNGRHLISGLPENFVLSSEDVHQAIASSVRAIVDGIMTVLGKIPPEIASDLIRSKIHLVGGGALMKGWTELIYKETGMEAVVEENPLEATAVGAMRAVPMAKKLRNYENSTLGN